MRSRPESERIGAGTTSFDAEVLFERLEKQFDLPAPTVDSGDRGGGKAAMLGEKHQGALLRVVPDLDAAQEQIALAAAGQLDRKMISSRRTGPRSGTGRRSTTP